MRIGISCFSGHGGSGVVATELGKALAARGHTVHFITPEIPFRVEELSDRLLFHQVKAMPYPVFPSTPYTLALATRMAEVGERYELDIIHAHYAIPHSAAAYLARVSGRRRMKVVTTLHGTDTRLVGLDRSYWHIVRFSIEQSHCVTAVSHNLRDGSVRDFELTRPVAVIHNFVDTQRFRPGLCPLLRSMVAANGEPVCLHVSNLRPVKRVLDLVRAHVRVTRETGARLVLVGNGPDREPAEQLANELGIGQKVTFLGSRDDVAPYLGVGDVFLMASEQESFGVAALEAMASGVPVVAMAVGGLPELVVDRETGFLTPPRDLDAFAEATIRLIQDDDLRRSYGENARRRAVERFDTEVIVPQYEACYQQALETDDPA